MEIYVVGMNYHVYHLWNAPDFSWSALFDTGLTTAHAHSGPVSLADGDGQVAAFSANVSDDVAYQRQSAPGGAFGPWGYLGPVIEGF
jgi:hypothetical protein